MFNPVCISKHCSSMLVSWPCANHLRSKRPASHQINFIHEAKRQRLKQCKGARLSGTTPLFDSICHMCRRKLLKEVFPCTDLPSFINNIESTASVNGKSSGPASWRRSPPVKHPHFIRQSDWSVPPAYNWPQNRV